MKKTMSLDELAFTRTSKWQMNAIKFIYVILKKQLMEKIDEYAL